MLHQSRQKGIFICRRSRFDVRLRTGVNWGASMWELITHSEEQTIALGRTIGALLRPMDVIMLEGELGSGKTRLAKGIVSVAASVSVDEVVSPTFTLVNTFEGEFPVLHADLYRLGPDQLEDLGIEDAVDEGAALVVEWAEKVREQWPNALLIVLNPAEGPDSRRITFQWDVAGSWAKRMEVVVARFH